MSRVLYIPRERKKYKKESRIGKKAIFFVVLFLAFAAGIVYATRVPALQVTKIEISGDQTITQERIRKKVEKLFEGNYVLIFPKKFIVFSRVDAIEGALKKEFPIIGEIEVIKHYPDELRIQFSERKLFAIMCNDLDIEEMSEMTSASTTVDVGEVERKDIQCVYIDHSGFAYEEAPNSSGSLIIKIASDEEKIEISRQVVDVSLVSKMQYVIEKMPEISGERIMEFELPSKLISEFRAKTSKGYMLLLKRDDDLENVFTVLKVVLDTEIKGKGGRLEYVDLRFGNKVFYKFK